jgi:cytochrome c oxidase subunit II
MLFIDLVLFFGYYLPYFLWTVHFSEPMGYWMMYFVDVYMAAFYYLTMVVVFVLWAVVAILWQFYYKLSVDPEDVDVNTVRYALVPFRHVTHNETLEFWWTVIPSVIIFFVALPALILIYAIETPLAAPVLTVKAIGHQWYWSYEYTNVLDKEVFEHFSHSSVCFDSYMVAESDLQLGQRRLLQVDKPAVLPIETQIRVIVTAADVLHSWAVPSLGVKMDAIPGRLNQFYLYIPLQGVYYGQCSELCGANHGFMPIVLYAVKPEVYVEWYLQNAVSYDARTFWA